MLKAKYKNRESQTESQNSVLSRQNTPKLYEKVNRDNNEGVINKSAYERYADKNTANTQISAKYQQYMNSEKQRTQDNKASSVVIGQVNVFFYDLRIFLDRRPCQVKRRVILPHSLRCPQKKQKRKKIS